MNENDSSSAGRPTRGYADTTGHTHRQEILTREQLQAMGQRRKDAEQKLERHQLEARSRESHHDTIPNPPDPTHDRP